VKAKSMEPKSSIGADSELNLFLKCVPQPPLCIECVAQALIEFGQGIRTKPLRGNLGDPQGNAFVCIRCLETRYHFDLGIDDRDVQDPQTIDAYLRNPAMRERIAKAVSDLRKVRQFYRDYLTRFWGLTNFIVSSRDGAGPQIGSRVQ
jgi:hypothetical protein